MGKFSIILVLIFYMFYSTSYIFPAYAQEKDIGESQINPASPLYFLKSIREILELKFAKTTDAKATRELEFATRRLREVNSLIKTARQDLIEPTLEMYLSHLQQLIGIANLRDENSARNLSGKIISHMSFLQTVYNQVSEPRAKRSIRATINSLSKWDQRLIDRFNSLKQFSLAEEVATSRLLGCNFLSKEASASALNEVEKAVVAEQAKKCFQDLKSSSLP